jgi:hypothetical protein
MATAGAHVTGNETSARPSRTTGGAAAWPLCVALSASPLWYQDYTPNGEPPATPHCNVREQWHTIRRMIMRIMVAFAFNHNLALSADAEPQQTTRQRGASDLRYQNSCAGSKTLFLKQSRKRTHGAGGAGCASTRDCGSDQWKGLAESTAAAAINAIRRRLHLLSVERARRKARHCATLSRMEANDHGNYT